MFSFDTCVIKNMLYMTWARLTMYVGLQATSLYLVGTGQMNGPNHRLVVDTFCGKAEGCGFTTLHRSADCDGRGNRANIDLDGPCVKVLGHYWDVKYPCVSANPKHFTAHLTYDEANV